MKREQALDAAQNQREPFDFLIIGGGATGLGAAVDAAARGYRVLLVEQHDFAKATSSRSTKLIHGGVRYLKQGNLTLVFEGLRERGLLCDNAPHLVYPGSFIVPIYHWWQWPLYGSGLKLYDWLAGKLNLRPSQFLSRAKTLLHLPTLNPHGLRGGIQYFDGQFDDARLAITLAQTIFDLGAFALNYSKIVSLIKEQGVVRGATIHDEEDGSEYDVRARVVINATGIFADWIRKLDDPATRAIITSSQGSHVVLPKSFLPGDSALMVPHTSDGRVLFAVPWHKRVVVGTTDKPARVISLEPIPTEEEIDFILNNAAQYFIKQPTRADVLSVFAGLRPLVSTGKVQDTAALSRDYTISVSASKLLTITGGKWTIYRKMAEEVINQAERIAGFPHRSSTTKQLRLHGAIGPAVQSAECRVQNVEYSTLSTPNSALGEGAMRNAEWRPHGESDQTRPNMHWSVYGTDATALHKLGTVEPALQALLHPALPYLAAEVVWAVREEMARTVEDVLARRTRALLLDAKASIQAAPQVARLIARELKRTETWEKQSLAEFTQLAQGYLLSTNDSYSLS